MAIASVGYGVSAILLNLLQGICLAVGSDKSEATFFEVNLFYIVTALILILAAALYFVEKGSPFLKYYTMGIN